MQQCTKPVEVRQSVRHISLQSVPSAQVGLVAVIAEVAEVFGLLSLHDKLAMTCVE